jgi:hypothetical protein
MIWSKTITQHNLLSTATDEERKDFIRRNLAAFNQHAAALLDEFGARDPRNDVDDEDEGSEDDE